MIEIEMSKDIRDFEPKIIGPLSVRQLACIGIGAVVALPVAFRLPFPLEVRLFLAIMIAAPFVICGFLKLYGMHAEVFFMKVLIPHLTQRKQRVYKSENSMGVLIGKPDTPNGKKKIRYSRNFRPKE